MYNCVIQHMMCNVPAIVSGKCKHVLKLDYVLFLIDFAMLCYNNVNPM